LPQRWTSTAGEPPVSVLFLLLLLLLLSRWANSAHNGMTDLLMMCRLRHKRCFMTSFWGRPVSILLARQCILLVLSDMQGYQVASLADLDYMVRQLWEIDPSYFQYSGCHCQAVS
jgi:hypothetical protein